MSKKKKSINDLIMEYFQNHPMQDLPHDPVVDWVEEQYLLLYQRKPRDPWRQIRVLYEKGKLIQVKEGVYRFDPNYVSNVELYDFPNHVKQEIFKRDNYKCVVCGRGRKDGVTICADHIKPKSRGGQNTLENGQTLCSEHNLLKKNYSQTEAGKRYFIKIYEDAITQKDEGMIRFCKSIFNIYDEYKVNGHIPRPNGVKK
jgi:hypothetical protein